MREVKVEIDEETLKRFEALPQAGQYREGKVWNPQEDALLLRYWPIKRHKEVADLLGVCTNTALKRYRQLTREQ